MKNNEIPTSDKLIDAYNYCIREIKCNTVDAQIVVEARYKSGQYDKATRDSKMEEMLEVATAGIQKLKEEMDKVIAELE
jgi:hypothetical protein